MTEKIVDIPGYEGLYGVTRSGRVYSYKRNIFLSETKPRSRWEYVLVGLYKDGRQKLFGVHRLVALTFIPNPNNLQIVNHKDGNKQNNCVENLEWCTQKENVAHALANDLRKQKAEARKIKWIP